MSHMQPLVLINAVGLTPKLLKFAPNLAAIAQKGWYRPLSECLPAVTTSAQATILTGQNPNVHGIVGNGWLFRDTMEVRFWQQANQLIQAEPLYATAQRLSRLKNQPFSSAKLFWWYNQGAKVDFSVTPKPYYGADGSKAFGITGTPNGLSSDLEKELGPFPFPTFWGPMAGLACTPWIARATASILEKHQPNLTMAYLPHLDYDPQRFGPSGCDMRKLVGELDEACKPILDAAIKTGARVWVVSEYGHVDVSRVVEPNRLLRKHQLLEVRDGPFGENIDFFNSKAFAVCDHQLAHVYVKDPENISKTRDLLESLPGVSKVLGEKEKQEQGLSHNRSGELIALSTPDAWFAYPYWLNDERAPDFARTVDIHRKPGYDPCELFLDPKLMFPKLRVARKLVAKKMGMRYLMDVIPLEASIVKGSHGLISTDSENCAILIGDGPNPPEGKIPMTSVRNLILHALGFEI